MRVSFIPITGAVAIALTLAATPVAPSSAQDTIRTAVTVTIAERGCFGTRIIWRGGQVLRDRPTYNGRVGLYLPAETPVTLCDKRGLWQGILVDGSAQFGCMINEVPPGVAYLGPCRTGWVPAYSLTAMPAEVVAVPTL